MIRLENVSKEYSADSPALINANVDIEKGEFVFLVGQSGSGKSTFIRLLNREEKPTQGKVYVAGKDIVGLSSWKVPFLRRNIGCILGCGQNCPWHNLALVVRTGPFDIGDGNAAQKTAGDSGLHFG